MIEREVLAVQKISIVMPSFNQGPYLEEAILSVLDQNYPAIELIVIDGGSTDESIDILRKYNDRIAYWVSEPDQGQSDALNKGFREVSGAILGWLNSDDTYQPGAFSEVANVFGEKETNIAMCQIFGLMEAEGTVYDHKENYYTDRQTLIRFWTTNGMTINQPSIFFRSNLIDEFDPIFDTTLEYAMDYDLWLRLATKHYIRVVDGYWANYRFHETSKSGTGFGKFFPEWHAVSQRYWGEKGSFEWWQNYSSHQYHHYGKRVLAGVLNRIRNIAGGR